MRSLFFKRQSFLASIFFGVICCDAAAWAEDFDYPHAGDSRISARDVYAAWNAKGAKVHKPGVKVIFFGRAEGCDLHASDGPVSGRGGRFSEAQELTGIPLSGDDDLRWAPSGNTGECDMSVRDEVADSFVHVNPDAKRGGIGLFTYAGKSPEGRKSFFRQYDKSGKGGAGANANIEGTFVSFRLDDKSGRPVRPWSDARGSAEFGTTQSVAAVSIGEEGRGGVTQAKQQLVLAFINPACMKDRDAKKMRCRFKYLFNTAVYRSGVDDWASVLWFRHADISFDPAQAGMPILHGPIVSRGGAVKYKNTELELYESLGEASQHGLFRDRQFRIRVSFEQFRNALRAVTARSLEKQLDAVTGEDIRSQFGRAWNDPGQWQLFNVAIGQEVVNPHDDGQVYIGGGVREIYVGPAR